MDGWMDGWMDGSAFSYVLLRRLNINTLKLDRVNTFFDLSFEPGKSLRGRLLGRGT